MGLSTRELELVLIAKDRASSVLARVGGSLVMLGVAMERLGAKGTRELQEMTSEAMNFQRSVALAFTQVDGVANASLESIRRTALDVAGDLSVPFDEIMPALYDIFSTIPVENMEQAEGILRAFVQSSIAGQAPVQDIARSTMAWLNALDLPPTVENANRILGVQFELVRKGAGTYEDFAGEVGKAIPAFVAASQSVETFGGMMAFMTRNGLSAAMAATSAARATELLFSPKGIRGMEALGIQVVDTTGSFRAIRDVMKDLLPHFAGLDDAQKKIKFREIFGEGRIQARRFFDAAFENFDEFSMLIDDMEGGGEALAEAFTLMFGTPAEQLELMKNRWQVFRIEIGERFLPLVVDKLLPAMERLWEIWQNMDEVQKDNLAKWLGYISIGLRLFGIITAFVGSMTLLSGLFSKVGTSMGAVFGRVALIIGVIIGIALAIKWAFDNSEMLREAWDKLWNWGVRAWENIKTAVLNIITILKEKWQIFVDENIEFFRRMWTRIQEIGDAAVAAWHDLWDRIIAVRDWFVELWQNIKDDVMPIVEDIWLRIQTIWDSAFAIIRELFGAFGALFRGDWDDLLFHLENAWNLTWEIIKSAGIIIWDAIRIAAIAIWEAWGDDITRIWQAAVDFFEPIWDPIVGVIVEVADFIKTYWDSIWRFLLAAVEIALAPIVAAFYGFWYAVQIVWELIKAAILYPIQGVFAILTGDWESFKDAMSGIWDSIKEIAVDTWNAIKDAILLPIGILISGMLLAWEGMKRFFITLWDEIKELFSGAWEDIVNVVKDSAQTFIDAMDVILGPWINFSNDVFGDNPEEFVPQEALDSIGLMGSSFADVKTSAQEIPDFLLEKLRPAVYSVGAAIGSSIGGKLMIAKGTITEMYDKLTYSLPSPINMLATIIQTKMEAPFNRVKSIVLTILGLLQAMGVNVNLPNWVQALLGAGNGTGTNTGTGTGGTGGLGGAGSGGGGAVAMQHGGHFKRGQSLWVGEREPELMRMGRSGSVYTMKQVQELMGGAGRPGGDFYFGDIKLEGDPNELAREIGWLVRFA